jgi:hypothetical protein
MNFSYGDLIKCTIESGDSDIFRFPGFNGENVILQLTSSSSLRPCMELIAPDNTRTVACGNAFSQRIDTTLSLTGTYTVLVSAFSFSGTYSLALQCVTGTCSPPNIRDDFNSDGKPDLEWQNQATGQIGVWSMDGVNLISPSYFNPAQVPDINWKIVGTGDFNLDSKVDLVWQNQASGHIAVWFMDGANLISPSYFNPAQVPDLNWKIVPNVWNLTN